MKTKRFYYSKSHVYGWCVYDRQTNTPAYEACCDYLPPVSDNEEGKVCVSPLCDTEYQAMRLCTRLNGIEKRMVRSISIDLHQLVRELLTDYNDNFIGEPCEEIIDEVIECIDPIIDEDHLVEHIEEILDRLFED